jgi:hypothetical protein
MFRPLLAILDRPFLFLPFFQALGNPGNLLQWWAIRIASPCGLTGKAALSSKAWQLSADSYL